MNADEVDAIRARAEAATPGPWRWRDDGYDSVVLDRSDDYVGGCPDCGVRAGFDESDAEFIAAARTDIPALLDALDEARAEAARLRRGGEELGKSLVFWLDLAVKVTGSEDCIDDDGDGDYGAVAERLAEMPARAAALKEQLAEVQRTSRVLPCDGLCSEYPEEDCSLHGREPAELWEAIAAKNKQAEAATSRAAALEATLAEVRALRVLDRARLAKVEALLEVQHDEGGQPWPWVAMFRAALATTSEEAPDA